MRPEVNFRRAHREGISLDFHIEIYFLERNIFWVSIKETDT